MTPDMKTIHNTVAIPLCYGNFSCTVCSYLAKFILQCDCIKKPLLPCFCLALGKARQSCDDEVRTESPFLQSRWNDEPSLKSQE